MDDGDSELYANSEMVNLTNQLNRLIHDSHDSDSFDSFTDEELEEGLDQEDETAPESSSMLRPNEVKSSSSLGKWPSKSEVAFPRSSPIEPTTSPAALLATTSPAALLATTSPAALLAAVGQGIRQTHPSLSLRRSSEGSAILGKSFTKKTSFLPDLNNLLQTRFQGPSFHSQIPEKNHRKPTPPSHPNFSESSASDPPREADGKGTLVITQSSEGRSSPTSQQRGGMSFTPTNQKDEEDDSLAEYENVDTDDDNDGPSQPNDFSSWNWTDPSQRKPILPRRSSSLRFADGSQNPPNPGEPPQLQPEYEEIDYIPLGEQGLSNVRAIKLHSPRLETRNTQKIPILHEPFSQPRFPQRVEQINRPRFPLSRPEHFKQPVLPFDRLVEQNRQKRLPINRPGEQNTQPRFPLNRPREQIVRPRLPINIQCELNVRPRLPINIQGQLNVRPRLPINRPGELNVRPSLPINRPGERNARPRFPINKSGDQNSPSRFQHVIGRQTTPTAVRGPRPNALAQPPIPPAKVSLSSPQPTTATHGPTQPALGPDYPKNTSKFFNQAESRNLRPTLPGPPPIRMPHPVRELRTDLPKANFRPANSRPHLEVPPKALLPDSLPLDNGLSISFLKVYESLLDKDYFHLIANASVNALLQEEKMFLFRPSSTNTDDHPLALCLLHSGTVYRFAVNRRSDGCFAIGKEKENEEKFRSIPEMVEFYSKNRFTFEGKSTFFGKAVPKIFR